jgi:hypothetical protein
MSAKRVRAGFYAPVWTWFALLCACSQSAAFAQAQEAPLRGPPSQVQEATSSQEASSSPQSQSQKQPERIFGVVPAYTITDEQNAPPLKSKEKFHLFVSGTLDPFPFVVYAMQAGIEQADDSHSGYGQGAAGYARRFGAALGDGTSARFFSTYVFPSLLHQDPRYFRKGEGSGWSRVRYSLTRGFVTRSDSRTTQPNWSNVLGKFAGAGLSNLYYPQEDRGASLTLSRVAISLGYQMLGNLAIEFWPEIHSKFLGGSKKHGSQPPKERLASGSAGLR